MSHTTETRPTTRRIKRHSMKWVWDIVDELIAPMTRPRDSEDCIDVKLTMRFDRVTGELIALVDTMEVGLVDDQKTAGGSTVHQTTLYDVGPEHRGRADCELIALLETME